MSIFDKYQPVSATAKGSVFSKYQPTPQATPQPQSNYIPGLSEIAGFGSYAAKGIGDVVGNTAKFGGEVLQYADPLKVATTGYEAVTGQKTGYESPIKQAGQLVKGVTDAAGRGVEMVSREGGGITKDSITAKLGEGTGWLVGNIGLASAGGSGGAQAGQGALSGLARLAGFGSKGVQTAGKIGGAIGSSIGSTQGSSIATRGEGASVGEMATGGVIDAATFGLGKAFKGLRNLAYTDAIGATPTEKALLQAKGIDVGDVMQKNIGFAPTKKAMANKLQKATSLLQSKADDILAKADAGQLTDASLSQEIIDGIGNAKEAVLKETAKVAKSERTKILKSFGEEAQEWIADLTGKRLGAKGVEEIYRDAAGRVDFKSLGKRNIGLLQQIAPDKIAKAQANLQIRKSAGDILDRVAPGVRDIKAQQAPLLALKEIAEKRGGRATGLSDVMGAVTSAATGNPFAGATAWLGSKFLQTPAARTGLATTAHTASKSMPYVSPWLKGLLASQNNQTPQRTQVFPQR